MTRAAARDRGERVGRAVNEFIGKITDTRTGWGAEWARFHDQRTSPLD